MFDRPVAAASDVSYLFGREISRDYHIVDHNMLRCCKVWRHVVGKVALGVVQVGLLGRLF